MRGFVPEGPQTWQFYRQDSSPEGHAPGWHNYLADPRTGVDSIKIVEQLYQQHRHWGGGNTGTRQVQSGKFAYTLTFAAAIAGAGGGMRRDGMQTNTQTGVQRAVRRVPAAEACKCKACTRIIPRPNSAPPRAMSGAARAARPGRRPRD